MQLNHLLPTLFSLPLTATALPSWHSGVYVTLNTWDDPSCPGASPRNLTVRGLHCQGFGDYTADAIPSVYAVEGGDTCQIWVGEEEGCGTDGWNVMLFPGMPIEWNMCGSYGGPIRSFQIQCD